MEHRSRGTVVCVLELVLLLCLSITASAQERADANRTAVVQVVQIYIDGWKNGDLEAVRKVVHPRARAFCPGTAGELQEVPLSKGFGGFSSRRHQELMALGQTEIASIEISGNIAIAKVQTIYRTLPNDVRVTEFLTLMQFTNNWRIVTKVRFVDDAKDEPRPSSGRNTLPKENPRSHH